MYTVTIERYSRQHMARHAGSNEVRFSGYDYSNGSKPLLIVAETPETVTVKTPGGSHWASMGQRNNHIAEYHVFGKLGDAGNGDIWVTEIAIIPVRTSNEVTNVPV